MTNTQQITINQAGHLNLRGMAAIHGWTEQAQMVGALIREREIEAASERLAATARIAAPSSFRRGIGRLLIAAGRRIAGESTPPAGSAAARPVRPMAA